ncbi:hypothetical protein [Pseudomonas sp. Leaf48]|nr:hypothetical protein [Pseudomonas sp. Leaf48]
MPPLDSVPGFHRPTFSCNELAQGVLLPLGVPEVHLEPGTE